IDECSQNPLQCGPNSICKNLLGRYKCSCTPGFSSPTGNNWILGQAGSFTCTDVNECADTTACPAYATCTDTKDSYYCTCKRGFLPSNGQSKFKGPGLKCIDIDECSQNPLQCGPNSICKNLLGRYKCSCTPGFSSPTGNNWILGQAGSFTCTDINECNTSGTCPEHSNCVNSVGSYSCECQDGFTSVNSTCQDVDECSRNSTLCGPNSVCLNIPGAYRCSCLPGFFMPDISTPEHPDTFKCTDIDECADIEMCPINAACTNTPGSYFCTCHPGFVASKGQLNFTGKSEKCRDIDECLKDPSPCGSNSICTNAPGSYSCSCTVGFRPNPEGSVKHGNFSCKSNNFLVCLDNGICVLL
ncbi:PREDICTED: EGF-like module-containing mucin-like hormone receptor-like 1, partial [Galeopterus variegatus]|uniref:EGF-like module-containing mucin-like hormone receptor-like 1 n=1 Tax=Galeopterus variegatus TaxID=482537 RepID=A0ABM0SCM1_GALVR